MVLTGRTEGPPLHPIGSPASVAQSAAVAFESITGAGVDGPALLGERAALMGLTRRGSTSCGGGTRLLQAEDGWWALNLARDADLVPALIERDARGDAWSAIAEWSAHRPASEIVGRATMLGLAAARLGETAAPARPWHVAASPGASISFTAVSVVNLGALWAAPLAAHLLGLAGADVVHVESATRRDPTRISAPSFYALLRENSRVQVVDFASPDDLRGLLSGADVVIEASRPRALAALGLSSAGVMADGRPRVWLRITGHPDPQRIAFGDDAAVGGGLVARSGREFVFAGDAIADPLTGLLGATVTSALLATGTPAVVGLHLSEVAAYCANWPSTAPEFADSTIRPPRVAARRKSTAFGFEKLRRA
jgi:CoA-transferase family III